MHSGPGLELKSAPGKQPGESLTSNDIYTITSVEKDLIKAKKQVNNQEFEFNNPQMVKFKCKNKA
jgi:hypothetical protein